MTAEGYQDGEGELEMGPPLDVEERADLIETNLGEFERKSRKAIVLFIFLAIGFGHLYLEYTKAEAKKSQMRFQSDADELQRLRDIEYEKNFIKYLSDRKKYQDKKERKRIEWNKKVDEDCKQLRDETEDTHEEFLQQAAKQKRQIRKLEEDAAAIDAKVPLLLEEMGDRVLETLERRMEDLRRERKLKAKKPLRDLKLEE
jgi:hypothetical protein